MKQTHLLLAVEVLAMLLISGMSPVRARAQVEPGLPLACGGPPANSTRVTWEYSPPFYDGTPHLVCAGETIASLIGKSHGEWGVAVRDLRTRETLLANPDQHFAAGSLYKLGVAAEALARIEAGSLAEESFVLVSEQDADPEYGGSRFAPGMYLSVRQAVHAMLTQSDNGAALALVDRLGLNAVNLRFASLGMPDTRLVYDAETTPRDVLSYFTLLSDGDVVSVEVSNSLVEVLAAQEINDRIPAGLPPGGGWWVAHKTANVDTMVGDAGIVYTPGAAGYVLIIINQGLADYSTSVEIIRSISQNVYRASVPVDAR